MQELCTKVERLKSTLEKTSDQNVECHSLIFVLDVIIEWKHNEKEAPNNFPIQNTKEIKKQNTMITNTRTTSINLEKNKEITSTKC